MKESKIKTVTEKTKELNKLVEQLEKLTISIISIIGWILILIKVLN